MEFTSGGGRVIGYSLVLLLFGATVLRENADKLCFLHDNPKLFMELLRIDKSVEVFHFIPMPVLQLQ